MRLGFVGLGAIGGAMSHRIASAGYDLSVFDVRQEAVDRVVEVGARGVADVATLSGCCEVCLICVVDDAQVRSVVAELTGAPQSTLTTIVVHSTILPTTVRELAEELAPSGITVIDAPVSGSETARWAGQLTMMVGGDPSVIEGLTDVFATCASSIFRAGPVGAGAALKLVNNLLALTGLLMVSEALELADASGLSIPAVQAVTEVSTGDMYAMRNLDFWTSFARIHPQRDDPHFMEFVRKDLRSALTAARASGLDLKLTTAAFDLAPELLEKFWSRPVVES